MKISIYDKDMNRVVFVDEQFVSCFWSEGYNTIGSFCLELIDTDVYRKHIRKDFYVGRNDMDTVMVIRSVEFKNGRIVASGKQATWLLDDVAMIGTIPSGANIDIDVRTAYNESTKVKKLEFAETDIGVLSNRQISNSSFWDVCSKLCSDTDLGIRVKRKNGFLLAEFYKPEENPNLVFSEKYGNLSGFEITMSSEGSKNVAIVLGQGTDSNRATVYVDLSNGSDVKELVVDARDLQQEETETLFEYFNRLNRRGEEKLLERQEVFSCSFIPSGEDFGVKYGLGDVLTIHMGEYGLKLKSRVMKFTQKSQNNKTETTVEVGQITTAR